MSELFLRCKDQTTADKIAVIRNNYKKAHYGVEMPEHLFWESCKAAGMMDIGIFNTCDVEYKVDKISSSDVIEIWSGCLHNPFPEIVDV